MTVLGLSAQSPDLLVEIVGIIGYYTLAAQTLNAFGMEKE